MLISRLYISALYHARKIKFSSYFNVASIQNNSILTCLKVSNLEEVYIFEHGPYISPLAAS